MNDKIDKIVEKVTAMVDTWIEEFSSNPIRTTIKVVVILWAIKWARRNLI